MSVYWFMFSIPVLMSILPIKFNNSLNYRLLLTYAFICVLFIGFRFEVGGDWGIYLEKSTDIHSKSFTEIFNPNNSSPSGFRGQGSAFSMYSLLSSSPHFNLAINSDPTPLVPSLSPKPTP